MKGPSFTMKIFLGMVLGVAVGHFWGQDAAQLDILSSVFLRLIKMVISPLVFSAIVVGIAKLGDFKAVGRIGIKTLIYFQSATLVALITGLLLVNFAQPGKHMRIELPKQGTDVGIQVTADHSLKTFVTHLIPSSLFDALAKNEILQIVIFSLFFGVALASLGKKGEGLLKGIDALSHLMFAMTRYVMSFAPFGVFGALAAVVGHYGIGILAGYLYLIACFYGGLFFFAFGLLGLVCFACRIPFIKLITYLKEPILLAFSTASSEVALPKAIERLERFGCSDRIVGFVLPLGYSFNLDGSILYMTFATMFIAQAYGISLSFHQQIIMLLMMMVTSKGMAGVPRASLIVIAGALASFNIPIEGLAIVIGIDQILDMGRSATNVIGNGVATAVISKWEGELQLSN
ncbi:MAG: cation:dicarboxylase symporter family transporter [Candidatus Margulisbacteria bacterium]|nr:cation:dicarboxylase symporter family transporter [Candidatus Margulisiibacteriota bacterium]